MTVIDLQFQEPVFVDCSNACSAFADSKVSAFVIKKHDEIPAWESFVQNHPKGSIYHSSVMQRCESFAKNREPYAYGALDSQGNLCALLATVRVNTLSICSSQLSSRSIFQAEPIYLDTAAGIQGVMQLIQKHDHYMRRQTLFAEVRPLFVPPNPAFDPLVACGYQKLGYTNYELSLDASEKELFDRIGAKRRNNVRASTKKGVTVFEDNSMEGLNTLYDLLEISHARSKIPLAHKSLLQAAILELPKDSFKILIARYKGEPISGGGFLAFKNRVICWYAGTKRIPGIAGTTMVFWQAIRQYASLGYEIFDFAGAGWQGEEYGPGRFKSKFGGRLVCCDRYRKVYAPKKMQVAEAIFHRVRQWIAPRSQRGKHYG